MKLRENDIEIYHCVREVNDRIHEYVIGPDWQSTSMGLPTTVCAACKMFKALFNADINSVGDMPEDARELIRALAGPHSFAIYQAVKAKRGLK